MMTIANPKILILTMYSGENEFEACKRALKEQTYTHYDFVTIENKPNLEAHHTLYQAIMQHKKDYDLFLKLDADMVLNGPDALQRMVDCWREVPETDHIMFAVFDFLPDKLSNGLHLFSNRVHWNLGHEILFVDPDPQRPGLKREIREEINPVVIHAPDPHPYHAFHFGLHRGLKAFQKNRFFAHPQSLGVWRTVQSTWNHFERTRHPKVGLAMLGVECARQNQISEAEGAQKNSPEAIAHFEKLQHMNPEEIYTRLKPYWRNKTMRNLRWWGDTGVRSLPKKLYRKMSTQIYSNSR